MKTAKRVCVIGAGPSGMSFLYHVEKLRAEGKDVPEVVCYEKQNNWGGIWNLSWRTGLDEHGEYVHGSMYRYLWSNGPKEASLEYPDYTFQDHYGKPIPSFPPRTVLFNYIQGRWNRLNLRRLVKFEHVVREVKYNQVTDNFTVVVKNLPEGTIQSPETFDYVINASGHFSFPVMPEFEGFDTFPGHISHSHDFRDANKFKGQRLLIIGSSYSAEDIALQTSKYGAKSVICSYRTKPMAFGNWPKQVSERPLLIRMDGKTATFKDDSTAEVDSIILCTGYKHHYPYMEESLTLKGPNVLFPDNLYKGTIWMKGGNHKLMYTGAMDYFYTWTMIDAQALWALRYIMGDVKLPTRAAMEASIEDWLARESALKDCHDQIDFQTAFTVDLAVEGDYGADLDVGDLFHTWEHTKDDNIQTYRDKRCVSKFTGIESPAHHTTFMVALDDTLECYMAAKNETNSVNGVH